MAIVNCHPTTDQHRAMMCPKVADVVIVFTMKMDIAHYGMQTYVPTITAIDGHQIRIALMLQLLRRIRFQEAAKINPVRQRRRRVGLQSTQRPQRLYRPKPMIITKQCVKLDDQRGHVSA
jgi:hypothetical protein